MPLDPLRPHRGQNIVELALILPLCLWVVLGIIDFGRVYYFYTAATNAAREGALYWAKNPTATTSQVKTRVQAEGQPQVTIDAARITLSSPSTNERQVQVQYVFTPITPFIARAWGGGSLTLTTQARMPTAS